MMEYIQLPVHTSHPVMLWREGGRGETEGEMKGGREGGGDEERE